MSIEYNTKECSLTHIITCIAAAEGNIDTIDTQQRQADQHRLSLRFSLPETYSVHTLTDQLMKIAPITIELHHDPIIEMHQGGKLSVISKIALENEQQLAMAYTPGVGKICQMIADDPQQAQQLTMKKNTVAIITDGSAVLGLGNIGPLAALPVMEGKAILMKQFADVDAFPICLDTQDVNQVIDTICHIAPGFGAINLEDIAAPHCFTIEAELKKRLSIPVFHDDQHGTAAVVTAALLNASQLLQKSLPDCRVVINGVGAAGTACKDMLLELGIRDIIGCDRQGTLTRARTHLNFAKQAFADSTNPRQVAGTLADALKDADVFIGVSAPGVLTVEHIQQMAAKPIVFAMANPIPEIMPEIAKEHVAIMATGRSDYPNQINNLLAFPGIFRGALDCQAHDINTHMRLAAAQAIATVIEPHNLRPDYIIPSVFDPRVATAVAQAVKTAAIESGANRQKK